MRPYVKYFFIFCLSFTIGALIFKKMDFTKNTSYPEIDWRDLGEFDYITGKSTTKLNSLDGKEIRVPGFMVPLEDNMRKVTEFLLVPSPQACIHVPPPPANQMVFVRMDESGTEAAFGPIWVYGILHIKSQRHMYGEASFSLNATHVEPYK